MERYGKREDWVAEERESDWGDGPCLRLGCLNFLLAGKDAPGAVYWSGREWVFSSAGMMQKHEAGSLACALEYRQAPEGTIDRLHAGKVLDLEEPGFVEARRQKKRLDESCQAARAKPKSFGI